MSFFDDSDQPTTRSRTSRLRPPPGGGERTGDQQTLLVRRGLAAAGGILVLILLVVGIKGCLSAQKENALKDYNREVGIIVEESDSRIGRQFFDSLAAGRARTPEDLQSDVNQRSAAAAELVKRARKLDVPDEMKRAQDHLLLVLELRRDALGRIAARLPSALSDSPGAGGAVGSITGQMQAFLASDVVYSQRVAPLIEKALADNDLGGQTVAQTRFLTNPLEFLDQTKVAERLGASVSPGGGGAAAGKPAPGLHGHSLDSVSVGDTTLEEGSANRIDASANLAFKVKFSNQGDNDESNVTVKIAISGSGRPITVQKAGIKSTAGAETTADIPLTQAPPIGTPVTIKVTVNPVPGEEKADNNELSFPAVFNR